MSRIIFFLPFICYLIFMGMATRFTFGVNFAFYILVGAFFISGLLLSFNKVLGGIVGILVSIYIIDLGTQNSMHDIEIWVGAILMIFYGVCLLHLLIKRKKEKNLQTS